MKPHIKFSVASIFLVLFITGCAYDPGSNNQGPGKTVPPKAGSTYTFKNVQTDTLGKPIDSTVYYTRDSIAEVGITYANKMNVTHVVSIDLTTGFSAGDFYYNYETNGDISLFVGGTGGLGGITLPDWRTFAVQSHTTAGYEIADTSVSMQGFPVPIHVIAYDTATYVNSGTYNAGTSNIPVYNLKDVITESASALILTIHTHTDTHYAFAPSLGYFVSIITDPTLIPAFIPSQGGSQSTMTAYVLK